MIAVIMAGGKGTRLRSIARDIPKPMIPIIDKPVLEYQIESLQKSGITDIVIITGYLGDIIQRYFKDGAHWGVHISYISEEEPLGTAGSLYYLKEKMTEDFFLIFGDLLLDVDWARFMDFHKSKQSIITLYGHPNSHPHDSDLIVVDQTGRVIQIDKKNTRRGRYYHNLVNAGIYCMASSSLDVIKLPEKMDLEEVVIAGEIAKGNVYVYRSTEYIKDMGTPERLYSVTEDIKNDVVTSRSLRSRQRCIFLDRDGTINQLKGFLRSTEQFELVPGVAKAVRKINASGFLAIVATNQPVVSRGECSFEELERIHMKMESLLGEEGAYLDDIFFCPHHPDKGYDGERAELKTVCRCRKPQIGMIEDAAQKYNIDLRQSWYIGDSTVDVQTGINAGMHTLLLYTGEGGRDGKYNVKAELEAANLLGAVNLILQKAQAVKGSCYGLHTETTELS